MRWILERWLKLLRLGRFQWMFTKVSYSLCKLGLTDLCLVHTIQELRFEVENLITRVVTLELD